MAMNASVLIVATIRKCGWKG